MCVGNDRGESTPGRPDAHCGVDSAVSVIPPFLTFYFFCEQIIRCSEGSAVKSEISIIMGRSKPISARSVHAASCQNNAGVCCDKAGVRLFALMVS